MTKVVSIGCRDTPKKAREQPKEDLPGVLVLDARSQINIGDHLLIQADKKQRFVVQVENVDTTEETVFLTFYNWPKAGSKLFSKREVNWTYGWDDILTILETPTKVTQGRRDYYEFKQLESFLEEKE